MPSYPLPHDTQTLLATALRGAGVSNLSLYLNRYVEFEQGRDGYELNEDAKKYKYAPLTAYGRGEDQRLLAAAARRHREMMQAAGADIRTAHPMVRCIVGLGAKGAREVGITLHHLYGFPIIPGSALKGLARACALSAIFKQLSDGGVRIRTEHEHGALAQLEHDLEAYQHKEDNKDREARLEYLDALHGPSEREGKEKEIKREDKPVWLFRHIFGTQGNAGDAIFFDAPPEQVSLEVDIMNPHYPDYYNAKGKDKPPADYYSPIPIYFLTVGSASSFIFGVASRSHSDKSKEKAWEWLKVGLETMGVGAKTTSGYGLFKFDK